MELYVALGPGKHQLDAGAELPGLPDGMKIDTAGNLWATGPGGIYIFTASGQQLGLIKTTVPTANLAWGDDGSTLYITSNTAVWRVKTKTKGKIPGAWPPLQSVCRGT